MVRDIINRCFRSNSKARTVAERLATGRAQTRKELVAGLNLSLTTVPRVVETLEAEGLRIRRDTDSHTREAIFQVVGYPEDPTAREGVIARYVTQREGAIARLMGLDAWDPSKIRVRVEIEGWGTYEGALRADRLPTVSLGDEGRVREVLLLRGGRLALRIGRQAMDEIEVADLIAVEGSPLPIRPS